MMRRTKEFRGISKRLAANYLENLGGQRADPDGDRIEGDGWTADLSAETVRVAGSMELTEVTVVFEGSEPVLEELIEDFTRKAMRAGG
jgi:molybdopterin synthase sulfur carrier subunit